MVIWLAVVAATGAMTFFISRSALMHLRHVEVSGMQHLPASQVIRGSGIDERTNAVWFSPAEAEAALERNPWIASATVERVLPWTVRIHIVERTPVASLAIPEGYAMIASDGTTLGTVAEDPGLPKIIGTAPMSEDGSPQSARSAALVLGSLNADLRSMVTDAGVDAAGAVQIHLQGGIQVDMGEPVSLQDKAEALAATLLWARQQHLSLTLIDVSSPRTPAIRFAA